MRSREVYNLTWFMRVSSCAETARLSCQGGLNSDWTFKGSVSPVSAVLAGLAWLLAMGESLRNVRKLLSSRQPSIGAVTELRLTLRCDIWAAGGGEQEAVSPNEWFRFLLWRSDTQMDVRGRVWPSVGEAIYERDSESGENCGEVSICKLPMLRLARFQQT